ncbi:MAG: head GIN domain-containing protein [Cryomorphaceae bacterium]
MKVGYTLLTVLIIGMLCSCGERIAGNGNVVEVSHDVDRFDEIDISGVFEVELIKGGSSVEVITDENLHEHIYIEVRDGELMIDTEDKMLDAEKLLLRIHYKSIEEIDVSGAVEIVTHEAIKGKSFELEISGACDGALDLDVDELSIEISGGGELELNGRADDTRIKISGAGEIEGSTLKTQHADIDITGAGDVEIAVSERLEIHITGAGDVKYIGDPEVQKSITGAGSVTKL